MKYALQELSDSKESIEFDLEAPITIIDKLTKNEKVYTKVVLTNLFTKGFNAIGEFRDLQGQILKEVTILGQELSRKDPNYEKNRDTATLAEEGTPQKIDFHHMIMGEAGMTFIQHQTINRILEFIRKHNLISLKAEDNLSTAVLSEKVVNELGYKHTLALLGSYVDFFTIEPAA